MRDSINYFAKRYLSCGVMETIAEIEEGSETEKATLQNKIINLHNQLRNQKTELTINKNQEIRETENKLKEELEIQIFQLNRENQKKLNQLNTKIRELEQTKTQIKNQLTAEKTAAIQKLETEKNKKIRELEQTKEQIRQQVLQERQKLENKLRDKVNKKLEKGGLFTPSEQGQNLEEATENLLDKQNKLENEIYNLKRDIGGIYQQLKEEKEKHANEKLQLKARIDKVLGDKNLFFGKNSDSLEEAIDEIFGNHHKQVRSNGDKCLSVVTAPFKWVSNKVGTGFALFGFMTVCPAILTGLG